MMQDYIGFTYNGKHSIRDLKIYRTSSGRYDDNITATMTDKTVDVPGGDGQYYFGTTFKNRTFTVAYAFDNLTESDIRLIKQTFSGDGIHELVFDERPYKVWSAKVTGTASMKHLCFEENGERVYKGEGSITFTCYYPFARTPKKLWAVKENGEYALEEKDGRFAGEYDSNIYTNKNEWINSDVVWNKNKQQYWETDSKYLLCGDRPASIKLSLKRHYTSNSNRTAYRLVVRSIFYLDTPFTGSGDYERAKTLVTFPNGVIFEGRNTNHEKANSQQLIWESDKGLVKFMESGEETCIIPSVGETCFKIQPGKAANNCVFGVVYDMYNVTYNDNNISTVTLYRENDHQWLNGAMGQPLDYSNPEGPKAPSGTFGYSFDPYSPIEFDFIYN